MNLHSSTSRSRYEPEPATGASAFGQLDPELERDDHRRSEVFSLGMPRWLRLLVLRMNLAGQGFSDSEMSGALQKYSNFAVTDVAAHLLRRRNSKRKRREDEAKIRAEIARRNTPR